MKVAVISDIHGNLLALDAVLDELQTAPVDRIVCLGDVVADGPQPQGVVARLQGLGCPVVRGNMDDWFLDPGPPEAGGEDSRRIGDIEHWGVSCLSIAEMDYLRTFRTTVSVALAGEAELLCVHGSPRSNTEDISATSSEDDLDRKLGGLQPAVLASGHTHAAMFRRHREMILINPGSVGSPSVRTAGGRRPCWAEYAVMTWQDGGASVDLRRRIVDFDLLALTARESGMPHADWWIQRWQDARAF